MIHFTKLLWKKHSQIRQKINRSLELKNSIEWQKTVVRLQKTWNISPGNHFYDTYMVILHPFWNLTALVLIHFNYVENWARILYLVFKKECGGVNLDHCLFFPSVSVSNLSERNTWVVRVLFRTSTVCVDSLCGSVWLCAKSWPHLCHFLPSVCDVARPEHSLGNHDTRLLARPHHPPRWVQLIHLPWYQYFAQNFSSQIVWVIKDFYLLANLCDWYDNQHTSFFILLIFIKPAFSILHV